MSTEKKKGANISSVVKSQRKVTTVNKKDAGFFNFKEWKFVVTGCTNIFNGMCISYSRYGVLLTGLIIIPFKGILP